MGRLKGRSAAIAGASVGLASDDSSGVTGQTIRVDGGLIASRRRREPVRGEAQP